MLAVIRQFHDGMQACVRLDDGECSDKFARSQARMRARATVVQHVFHGGTACGRETFLADAAITDKKVQLQQKEKGEKKGTSRTSKVDGRRGKEGEEVQILWVCCTRTMQASYRDHQEGWRG